VRQVLWLDANLEVRGPLHEIRDLLRRNGYFFTVTGWLFPVEGLNAAPETLHTLGCAHQATASHRECSASVQGYVRGSKACRDLLLPSLKCAYDANCICPQGTNRSNHRQDQTVKKSLPNPITTALLLLLITGPNEFIFCENLADMPGTQLLNISVAAITIG
jgi:hypothetical protein